MRSLWVLGCVALIGCAPAMGIPEPQGLPVLHPYDAARAEHGHQLLTVDTVSSAAVPRAGIENLWLVWEDGYTGDYWAAFRARYGLHEARFDNDGLPMGIRPVGKYVTFDCLLCHASTVAGQAVIGVANSTLDVQSLLDDLEKAAAAIGVKPPVTLRDRTAAAGAVDAVGMAFAFGETYYGAPEGTLNKNCGWERAPAWWQLKHKKRAFNDGSGESPGFRTMAGTLLAFGLTIDQIAARADDFEDIGNYILSLEPPASPFGKLDLGKLSDGRKVFDKTCGGCHGTYGGDTASFPDVIVDAHDVGTDPMREELFRSQEVDAINSTWLGQPNLTKTNGYLSPTLVGIWARAPYFHNGSVPDLVGVLDSSSRPSVWRRTGVGAADWDMERIGWRYDVPTDMPDPNTLAGRKIYDTKRAGLSNAGHTYGDALSAVDRAAVLEYLKSL